MKFLIDADSPYSLVKVFNDKGYRALHVKDILKFASDEQIFNYANQNKFLIVTKDLGFAEMFLKNKGYGLLLIRLPYYFTSNKIIKTVEKFLEHADAKAFINAITVVELDRYRIKKLD